MKIELIEEVWATKLLLENTVGGAGLRTRDWLRNWQRIGEGNGVARPKDDGREKS